MKEYSAPEPVTSFQALLYFHLNNETNIIPGNTTKAWRVFYRIGVFHGFIWRSKAIAFGNRILFSR